MTWSTAGAAEPARGPQIRLPPEVAGVNTGAKATGPASNSCELVSKSHPAFANA